MSDRNKIAVVLGSGLMPDGTASPVTRLRALKAAKFVSKHPMPLILSGHRSIGDNGAHGTSEAEAMLKIVREQGIETPCMLEEDSFNTLGNAILTTVYFLQNETPGTLYIVTSPFHMERAKFIFGRVLGPKWRVRGVQCKEWSEETRHKKSDEALERARAFFKNVEPGDMKACLMRLEESSPAYQAIIRIG